MVEIIVKVAVLQGSTKFSKKLYFGIFNGGVKARPFGERAVTVML